jgi:hypothetical protein
VDETVPGYEIVDTIESTGGGYDWTAMRIYRKDGRLFANTQSGCSCNWYETPAEGDLVELSNLAAAERYYNEDNWYDMPKWIDVVERFRSYGLR